MIKSVDFTGETFENKNELFKRLKQNKTLLIDKKKAAIKKSDSIGIGFKKISETSKALTPSEGSTIAVINTTKYIDSHSDVHLNGIWNKSIKDQQGKIYYVANHELEVGKVIVYPEDLTVRLEEVNWSDLGADYQGKTQALIYEFKNDSIEYAEARKIIEKQREMQNSVRMQYVDIKLAIDSNEEDYKEEKEVWDMFINDIANKEKAIEQGYFWAVGEAKIYKEGSMVLEGSNDVTPMRYKSIESGNTTHKEEPSNDTLNKLKFNHYI